MRTINLTPSTFWALVPLMESLAEDSAGVRAVRVSLDSLAAGVQTQLDELSRAQREIADEIRRTTMRRPMRSLEEDLDDSQFPHSVTGDTFLDVILGILRRTLETCKQFSELLRNLQPAPLVLPEERPSGKLSMEMLRDFAMLRDVNATAMQKFVTGIGTIAHMPDGIFQGLRAVTQAMDHYYHLLYRRHALEGIKIHHNPITTDIAMSVLENIDAHGECKREGDTLSAYSTRKAMLLADDMLAPHVVMTPSDLDASIDQALGNLAILNEIETAKRTYATARAMLSQLREPGKDAA